MLSNYQSASCNSHPVLPQGSMNKVAIMTGMEAMHGLTFTKADLVSWNSAKSSDQHSSTDSINPRGPSQ